MIVGVICVILCFVAIFITCMGLWAMCETNWNSLKSLNDEVEELRKKVEDDA